MANKEEIKDFAKRTGITVLSAMLQGAGMAGGAYLAGKAISGISKDAVMPGTLSAMSLGTKGLGPLGL